MPDLSGEPLVLREVPSELLASKEVPVCVKTLDGGGSELRPYLDFQLPLGRIQQPATDTNAEILVRRAVLVVLECFNSRRRSSV
jgi:hypothetical protein